MLYFLHYAITIKLQTNSTCSPSADSASSARLESPEGNETPYLMVQRWETINKDFYKKKEKCYDLTKVPSLSLVTRLQINVLVACLHYIHVH